MLAGILGVADVFIRRGVQESVADRIETFTPGRTPPVKISSFPFLGRLAVSGTVPTLRADVTGVTVGNLSLGPIDLTVSNLKLSRHELFRGEVQAVSIGRSEVVVDVPQTRSTPSSISRSPSAATRSPSTGSRRRCTPWSSTAP